MTTLGLQNREEGLQYHPNFMSLQYRIPDEDPERSSSTGNLYVSSGTSTSLDRVPFVGTVTRPRVYGLG